MGKRRLALEAGVFGQGSCEEERQVGHGCAGACVEQHELSFGLPFFAKQDRGRVG